MCVNLYPFERVVGSARRRATTEVIENIDIGGPTLIRAAAKNHAFAAVVVAPESYDAVLEELRESDGRLSEPHPRGARASRRSRYTARYDAAISRWFAEREDDFPAQLHARRSRRCSTSPTARTRTSAPPTTPQAGARTHLLSMVSKLHGKELSFNNLLDLDSGRRLVERVRAARRGDHQAQQPVRRGGRRRR